MIFTLFFYVLLQDISISNKIIKGLADESRVDVTLIRDSGKTKTLVYGEGLEFNVFILEDSAVNKQFYKTKNSDIYMIFKKDNEKVFFSDFEHPRILEYQIQNHKMLSHDVGSLVYSIVAIPKSTDWLVIYRNGNVVRTSSDFVAIETILSNDKMIHKYLFVDNLFVYCDTDKDAEKSSVQVINISTKTIKWAFPLKLVAAKYLGITLGYFPDSVSAFHKENNALIIVTLGGSLYRVNFLTGEIMNSVDRFKGDGNNAGLIPSAVFVDINKDGFADILGGSVDKNIYAINGKTLEVLWEFEGEEEIQMPSLCFDYNSDGTLDLISLDDYMNLYINNGINGELLFFKNLDEKGQAWMSLGKDEKNRDYIVLGYSKGVKYVFLN